MSWRVFPCQHIFKGNDKILSGDITSPNGNNVLQGWRDEKIKPLAAQPDDLSSVPENYVGGKRQRPPARRPPIPTCVLWHTSKKFKTKTKPFAVYFWLFYIYSTALQD